MTFPDNMVVESVRMISEKRYITTICLVYSWRILSQIRELMPESNRTPLLHNLVSVRDARPKEKIIKGHENDTKGECKVQFSTHLSLKAIILVIHRTTLV